MFEPNFLVTPSIAQLLIKIELLKHEIQQLPITPSVLISLRESVRLQTVHYSTAIEGNRLSIEQVEDLIKMGASLPGRQRDQEEVLGYYEALEYVHKRAINHSMLKEEDVQLVHALVVGKGKTIDKIKPTQWRDGQNAIYDSGTRNIVYLPPEARDVPVLMSDLIYWINQSEKDSLPYPLIAALTHYQFATIHPYFDGNGRTARLLTTLILARGSYDLKGIYSLEEYYAKDLQNYYRAISLGPSHNYYFGRAQADITPWVNYFLNGMYDSFSKVKGHALVEYHKGHQDKSEALRMLDAQQQAVLQLFRKSKIVTCHDVSSFFNVTARKARTLCQKWTSNGFLVIRDPSKKSRTYQLNPDIDKIIYS